MSFRTKCAVAFTAPERTEGRRGMRRVRSVLGVVAAGGVLSMVMSTGVVGATVSKAQEVFVTNDSTNPVPVAGTVSVGNWPAIQPVSGTVDVGSLPAPPVVTTVEIINRDQEFDKAAPGVDVSMYRTVRLNVTPPYGCTNGTVHVVGDLDYSVIDVFSISYVSDGGRGAVSRAYEVPGTTFHVYVYGCDGYAMVKAWGRSN